MDSSGNPSATILKSPYGRQEEARAAGAIKCGHLVKLNGDNELVVHATSGGFAERAFATEEIHIIEGKDLSDDYADDDLVSYTLCLPGDEVYAWLLDGENVDEGDHLISNGDGTLIKTTGTPKQIIAVAREAKDLSAVGNTTNARIKVRVM